jgi:hypothetical protein
MQIAAVTLCLGLCGLGGAAWAANVVLLDTSGNPALPPGDQAKLRAAAEAALKEEQFTLIPAGDVDAVLSGEAQLKGCYSEVCFERLGRVLEGRTVVRYEAKPPVATKHGGGDWHIAVDVLDVDVGAFGSRLNEDCPHCTIKQAADLLADLIKRGAIQTGGLPRGVLQVDSTPASAAVFVDGSELGITPYKRPTFAGPHKLVIRHIGYRSEQVTTIVTGGQPQSVAVTLVTGEDPVKVVVVEREKKTPIYKKGWFWVAVIGGAAVVAGAVTAGVILSAPMTTSSNQMLPANTFMFTF